ncbi:MAG: hypothetical protein WBA45_11740 [Microthrixaceae bacterium]
MIASTRTPAPGARVLVVEDDRDTALLLCSLLAVAGFDARPLPDTADVARVMLGEKITAAVVSMSGGGIVSVASLVSSLRQRPEPALRDAALVALVDDEFDLFFGLGAEVDSSLVRPISPVGLVDAVTEAAATHPEARRARLYSAI